jgi:hypothetical protein
MRIATSPAFPFFDTQTMTNADPGFPFSVCRRNAAFHLVLELHRYLGLYFVPFFPYVSFHVKRQASWRCCVYSWMSKYDVTYEMSNTNRCLSISTLVVHECACELPNTIGHAMSYAQVVPASGGTRANIQTCDWLHMNKKPCESSSSAALRRCSVQYAARVDSHSHPTRVTPCQGRRQLPRYDTTAAALRHTASWYPPQVLTTHHSRHARCFQWMG